MKVTEEAGIFFPNNVKKRLEDAKNFHHKIIENRKNFLNSEMLEIEIQISNFDNLIKSKTNQRAKFLNVLKKFGALMNIQNFINFLNKKHKLDDIKTKIEEFKNISIEKKKIKEDKIVLESKVQIDYQESKPYWEKALDLFSENSGTLYSSSGNKMITVTMDMILT